jgi:choline dehydrogenase
LYSPHLHHIGTNGPIHVSHSSLLPETKTFRDALKKAWVSKGEKLNDDIYGGE